ncbi:Hypothetical predicted protein [Paramuricea clavata]|uniref:Uncharacterized protein n=1 Tax=Paramuricea clavata TaxID=317549 RepID=A0A7D9LJV9_PARCT|nr:Hypothetical predicted protein [Paramuricea clavata]
MAASEAAGSRFVRVDEEDINQIIEDTILKSTKRETSWSIAIFRDSKQILECEAKENQGMWFSKVKHHSIIPPEDIQKCYESGIFGDYSPLSLLRVNWFNINLYFCRRGRENQRKLSKNSFIFKTDANIVGYVEMAEEEKTKNHRGGLSDNFNF